MQQKQSTSWHGVGKWYNELVSDKGHYFHQHLIIPNVLRLLHLEPNSRLLDLACGQGVLARNISKNVLYLGIDIARSLVEIAKKQDHNPNHQYVIADVTQPLPIQEKDFTHATVILALQNIENPELVLVNVSRHLQPRGKLIIVLNHPCFRIPRQSSWVIDEKNKLEYRRINRYMSPLKIPINMHPGQSTSPVTWSFHHPLSTYTQWFQSSGFVISKIEEWTSDKSSVGKAARMENRSRSEFPLFLTFVCQKI